MKKNILILLLIPFISLINCQNKKLSKSELLLMSSYDLLRKDHFVKKEINQDFFKQVFNIYLYFIDPHKIFLLESEKKELFDKSTLKNGEKSLNIKSLLDLFAQTHDILTKRKTNYFAFVQKNLSQPIHLETDKEYVLDRQKVAFAMSEKELIPRWENFLQHELINAIALRMYPNTESLSKKKEEREDLETVKKEEQKKLLESATTSRELIKSTQKKEYLDLYIKSMAMSYDRHSNYLSPVEKQDFDLRMQGSFEGIGASLHKKPDGLIEIVNIIPGGPSYRQKQLEAGDQIIKIRTKTNDYVETKKITLRKAISLIRGKKGTIIYMTVKKKDGTMKDISIIRDKVILEEGFAKSAILKKNKKKIGYLRLPTFYKDFSKQNAPRSSSEDIRRELEYFNQEEVEGLIFDLRGNPGGYLQESVKIAGFFFERGPVVIVKTPTDSKIPHVDTDPSIIFDKPVIVFVDNGSASASEIVAGALQDYGRAVVVGGKKSYGKGTVQVAYALSNLAKYYGVDPGKYNLGSLKFTVNKFYRVTGVSTQLLGIVPDIVLPYREMANPDKKSLFGIIENDHIAPVSYKKWSNYGYNLQKLRKKSHLRVAKKDSFTKIENIEKVIQNHRKREKYLLSLKKNLEVRKKFLSQLDMYTAKNTEKPLNFRVEGKPFTQMKKEESGFKEKSVIYKEWLKNLGKDFYLEEAVEVMQDILAS